MKPVAYYIRMPQLHASNSCWFGIKEKSWKLINRKLTLNKVSAILAATRNVI
jgi:hypothetical protein